MTHNYHKTQGPLRRVTGMEGDKVVLKCGHLVAPKRGVYPIKRRCAQCGPGVVPQPTFELPAQWARLNAREYGVVKHKAKKVAA